MALVWSLVAFAAAWKRTSRAVPDGHPVREKIVETVTTRLGINEARIQSAIGQSRSVVRYHLRLLVRSGVLQRFPVGRENHYFPSGTDSSTMRSMAAATHGQAKKILRAVFLDPGLTQSELAEAVGLTRKVLRHYVDFLGEHGLIAEARDSRFQRYWAGDAADSSLHARVLQNPALGLSQSDDDRPSDDRRRPRTPEPADLRP